MFRITEEESNHPTDIHFKTTSVTWTTLRLQPLAPGAFILIQLEPPFHYTEKFLLYFKFYLSILDLNIFSIIQIVTCITTRYFLGQII